MSALKQVTFLFALLLSTGVSFQASHLHALNPSSRQLVSRARTSTSLASATEGTFVWQGNNIYTEVREKPNATPVLLIHGFGCSTTYWRATAEALAEAGYEVHSLDLLGQGRSEKPGDVYYSINLWAQLVDDYAAQVIGSDGVVLMGNSLGSLVALAAATGDHAEDGTAFLSSGRVKGVCMFNCGVGLNSAGIVKDPQFNSAKRLLISAIFALLNTLVFRNKLLLNYVLNDVVTKDLLRDTLQNLYKYDPSRVDDVLVESFYLPAKDKGSVEALSQIYTNDPGLTPLELHSKHAEKLSNFGDDSGALPIHLVWGNDDVVTPLTGLVGQFYTDLAQNPESGVSLDIIQAGHVPFDDNPEESNRAMLEWLKQIAPPKKDGFEFNMDWFFSR